MKVQNFDEEFVVTYGGHEFVIPVGLSNEFPDDIGYHIQYIADKWKKNVKLIHTRDEEIELLKAQLEQTKKEAELSKENSSASTSHISSTEEGLQQLIQRDTKFEEVVVESKKPGRPKKV